MPRKRLRLVLAAAGIALAAAFGALFVSETEAPAVPWLAAETGRTLSENSITVYQLPTPPAGWYRKAWAKVRGYRFRAESIDEGGTNAVIVEDAWGLPLVAVYAGEAEVISFRGGLPLTAVAPDARTTTIFRFPPAPLWHGIRNRYSRF